jgi:hypothetical protein
MKTISAIAFLLGALTLSACATSKPVPMGFMMSSPGDNAAFSNT